MSLNNDSQHLPSTAKMIQEVPGITEPLVIRIGVTGHKHFITDNASGGGSADEFANRIKQKLERRIEAVLNYLDLLLAYTTRSYRVISPLAEGGDIILTDIILKHEAPHLSLFESPSLQLILPMPEDVYLNEFTDEGQRSAFLRLKDRAANKEAPPLSANAFTKGDKSRAYRIVTEAVVNECDILIAAWDGNLTNKSAGTAATVQEARRLGKPVIHILTPRLSKAESRTSPLSYLWDTIERVLLPIIVRLRAAPMLFRVFGINIFDDENSTLASLKHLDSFNEDLQSQAWSSQRTELSLKDPEETAREVRNSYASICKPVTDRSAMEYFEATFGHDLKQVLLPIWRQSSKLARHFQQRYNRAVGTAAYILAASAVVTVSAITSLFPSAHPLYWLEVIEAVSILFILWLSWHFEWHRKRIEYRMLSERLRAAIFLYIAGIRPERLTLPAYFHPSRDTTGWVINLFNTLTSHMRLRAVWPSQYFKPLRDLISKSWLDDQLQYYKRQAEIQHFRHKFLEIAGLIMFSLTIIIAIIHALGIGHEKSLQTAVLNILALSLPAVGGAIGGILAHREYRRNAHRYHQMVRALQPLVLQAQTTDNFATLQKILQEAHELMLREQQTWLLTVGVEPPTPA